MAERHRDLPTTVLARMLGIHIGVAVCLAARLRQRLDRLRTTSAEQ